jgi:hypothetical protein
MSVACDTLEVMTLPDGWQMYRDYTHGQKEQPAVAGQRRFNSFHP